MWFQVFISIALLKIIASDFVCNELTRSPQQIRLAYRKSGVTVSWTTSGMPNTANDSPNPTVLYGLSPSELLNQSTGSSTTYGTHWFHNVAIIGLVPSTTYYYMISGTPYVTASANYSFRSAQDSSSTNQSFTVTILGDLGVNRSPFVGIY